MYGFFRHKRLFLVAVFILTKSITFGQVTMGYNLIPFAWDLNYSENKIFTNGLSVGLLNFYIESTKTGIGFEIIPIQYQYLQKKHIGSILHFTAYWDILHDDFFRDYSIMGPFVSIDYPNWILTDNFTFKDYLLTIGFRYTLRLVNGGFIPIASIEGGYRNLNGKNNYYLNVRIHFGSILGVAYFFSTPFKVF